MIDKPNFNRFSEIAGNQVVNFTASQAHETRFSREGGRGSANWARLVRLFLDQRPGRARVNIDQITYSPS